MFSPECWREINRLTSGKGHHLKLFSNLTVSYLIKLRVPQSNALLKDADILIPEVGDKIETPDYKKFNFY